MSNKKKLYICNHPFLDCLVGWCILTLVLCYEFWNWRWLLLYNQSHLYLCLRLSESWLVGWDSWWLTSWCIDVGSRLFLLTLFFSFNLIIVVKNLYQVCQCLKAFRLKTISCQLSQKNFSFSVPSFEWLVVRWVVRRDSVYMCMFVWHVYQNHFFCSFSTWATKCTLSIIQDRHDFA